MSTLPASSCVTLCGIQHFSLFNGKGIRTTIFFKGCPLRCVWCCNPESQESSCSVAFDRSSCIGIRQCGYCIPQCPYGAIYAVSPDQIGFARDLCCNCGKCVTACPSMAFFQIGEKLDPDEIMRRVLMDAEYIRADGGVTLSGGEPFMRPQAAATILRRCHEARLHTAVETCGFFDLDDRYVRMALKDTDILYYDIKQMDPAKHKQGTELDNARILHNLERIGKEFPTLKLVTRTEIIPNFNDTLADFFAIAQFVKTIASVSHHELLPCNTYCGEKYTQMGLPIPSALSGKVSLSFLQQCISAGESIGLHVTLLS